MSAPAPEAPSIRFFDWRIIPLLVLTVVVMGVLVHRIAGGGELLDVLQSADFAMAASALPLSGLNIVLAAWRWRIVLAAMGYVVPLKRAVGVVLATWPLAVITPSRASDVLRAVCVRDIVPTFAGAGSVMAEKLADVQSLCLLAICGAAVYRMWAMLAIFVALLACEWVGIFVLMRYGRRLSAIGPFRRFEDKVDRMLAAFDALRQRPIFLLRLCGASLLAMGNTIVIAFILLVAMGVDVSILEVAALWPVASFVGMLPLTVAGMGTRDATFVYLLTLATERDQPEAAVLAATFAYALIAVWLIAIVGIPFMIRLALSLRRTQPTEIPP